MLNIILPSLPYQRIIDPMWQEEMGVARQCGYQVCLFDAEQKKLYQPPSPNYPTVYRGWMLSEVEYQQLASMTPLLVSVAMYLASHRASGWYEAIADFTPRSNIVAAGAAEAAVDAFLCRDGRCFVKGLSKSFGADSVVSLSAGFRALLQKQEIGPSELLFVRQFVDLSDHPEQRFFVVQEEVFGAEGQLFPEALKPALQALKSRWFYTVDVAYNQSGQPVIIEVGDGQVSDTKEWSVAELYSKVIYRLMGVAAT